MSLDYYMVCLDCKQEVCFKWGAADAYRYAFHKDYDPKSIDYGKERIKEIVDFLEAHEHNCCDSHHIVYMNEHNYFDIKADELFKNNIKKEKERIKAPQLGEISEVLSKLIPLGTGAGGDLYPTAACPFHKDDFTSMIVDVANQRFNCTACGANGNLWGFLKLYMEDKKVALFRPEQLIEKPKEQNHD